ncbi:MAG: flagellar protein FliT [Phycisphaerales bacterium]|nr:MAG: flagellar protein FliT [Phycisphaerales bacterium]
MTSSNSIKNAPERCLRLLDELQSLLNEQIKLVRKGDFSASEALAEESGRLVDEFSQIDVSEHVEHRERLERLTKSYRTVIFSVAAEKDRLEKQLQQISRGRKTLRTYHGYG